MHMCAGGDWRCRVNVPYWGVLLAIVSPLLSCVCALHLCLGIQCQFNDKLSLACGVSHSATFVSWLPLALNQCPVAVGAWPVTMLSQHCRGLWYCSRQLSWHVCPCHCPRAAIVPICIALPGVCLCAPGQCVHFCAPWQATFVHGATGAPCSLSCTHAHPFPLMYTMLPCRQGINTLQGSLWGIVSFMPCRYGVKWLHTQ